MGMREAAKKAFYQWLSAFIKESGWVKKLKNFGGHLLKIDDHSYWAPTYWNIFKDTFLWVELNYKSNSNNCQLRVLGMFTKK